VEDADRFVPAVAVAVDAMRVVAVLMVAVLVVAVLVVAVLVVAVVVAVVVDADAVAVAVGVSVVVEVAVTVAVAVAVVVTSVIMAVAAVGGAMLGARRTPPVGKSFPETTLKCSTKSRSCPSCPWSSTRCVQSTRLPRLWPTPQHGHGQKTPRTPPVLYLMRPLRPVTWRRRPPSTR